MRAAPAALVVALSLLAPPRPALAAEATEIVNAYAPSSPWALRASLGLDWISRERRASIGREFICVEREAIGGESLCPQGSGARVARELHAERRTTTLDLGAELGLGAYLALQLTVPLILEDQTSLSFDEDVDPHNSLSAPYNGPALLEIPRAGPKRAGVGDLRAALRVAPTASVDDRDQSAWVLELSLVAPSAPIKHAGDGAVGEGLWTVGLSSAWSARALPWLDFFFSLDGHLAVASSASPLQPLGPTQTVAGPAQRAGVSFGLDLIPFERPSVRSAVHLELGGRMEFVSDGRGYSDLFEALGGSPCAPEDPEAPCLLTTYDRGDRDPATGLPRRADGLTNIERHALLSGWLGVRYEVFESLRLRARARVAGETDHFLTFAEPGVDLDGGGDVRPLNNDGVNELNPVYNSEYDKPGSRFRSSAALTLGVDLAIQGRF